jgi:hypothetical protein
LSWFADNIFYNGKRLGDVVPIDDAIDAIWDEAEAA